MTAPTLFNFHGNNVRVVMRGESPWFVATDICAALGYQNPSKAVADHLDDDERSHEQLDRSRMGSPAVVINESGLYALVLRSRKPEARKFAKWVTSEVLPSIRKTGGYGTAETLSSKAYEMVLLVMSAIQAELFKLLAGGNFDFERDGVALSFRREMVPFEHSKLVPVVKKTDRYTLLMTPTELAERIKKGDYPIADYEVGELAEACGQYLKGYTRGKYESRIEATRAKHQSELALMPS
jgi:prophage antirepressor-like protein